MPYYRQDFRNTDLNGPPLCGTVGSAINLFNACLKDGYNFTVTITSLTRSGTTATATVSTADALKLATGNILTVAGVTGPGGGDPALYNGTFQITYGGALTFTYTMAGTPSGSATGTITATSRLPVTSITRGGTGNLTATMVLTNANATLNVNDKIVVQGDVSAGALIYNTTQTIETVSTVLGVTTVTFLMPSDPGANATGTITYYKAGLQWAHAVAAGTNSQSYVSQDTTGVVGDTYTPRPIQVVDNGATAGGAKEAQIWSYESIASDQSGTARWPTTVQWTNGLCMRKSNTADTTRREWVLTGTGKTFVYYCKDGNATWTWYQPVTFGYVIPEHAGDAYNTVIGGGDTFNNGGFAQSGGSRLAAFGSAPSATYPLYMPRLWNQAGTSVACSFVGSASDGIWGGTAILTYPLPSNGALVTQRVWITDVTGNLRARMPGLHAPLHQYPMNTGEYSTNNTGLPGVTLRAVDITAGGTRGQHFYEAIGDWD